jgi:hypothetical protein
LVNTATTLDIRNGYASEGRLFQAFHRSDIATNTSMTISFTTGNKEYKAFPTGISTSGDKLLFEYFEDATVNGGTTITAQNQNRVSTNVSDVVIKLNPTVSAQGNKIAQIWLAGAVGVGQSRSGANAVSGDSFWTLKPNTTYILKFNNGSTNTNTVQFNEAWIEL